MKMQPYVVANIRGMVSEIHKICVCCTEIMGETLECPVKIQIISKVYEMNAQNSES